MLSLSYCLHTLDLFLDLDRGWGAVAELTEETVDIVDMGDMVEVRPLKELKPLSLLLWL